MSLVACTDKERKHRISASDNLPRKDYYCPNRKCNAVLRLVDCDDNVRKDHFRAKVDTPHIDNCRFKDESIYLSHNNMTNEECEILTSALDKAKNNLRRLVKLLDLYYSEDSITRSVYILKPFRVWLNRNLTKQRSLHTMAKVFRNVYEYVDSFTVNKFKYAIHKKDPLAQCIPFKSFKIDLCDAFFVKRIDNLLIQQETIVHEAFHQVYKKADWGYGEKCQKYTTIFKRWNADNYSSCFYDIFLNEARIEWHE